MKNDGQSGNCMNEKGHVVVVMPAYNEEVAIGSMVLRARKQVDRVIVIDDGSTDRTAEVAGLAGAEVIRHPRNIGKGAALKTGFLEASKNGTSILITMDSDGQNNPSDIPKLIQPILNGNADIVNGSRYVNGKGKNTPKYRRLGQMILDKATNINSGTHITDTQSGFRAFARRTLPVFKFKQNGMAIESEMLMEAANAGLRVNEVEIGIRYDVKGSKLNPINHGVKVLVNVLADMELNRPLYYFTFPGIILSTIGLAMGLSFLQDFYHGANMSFGLTLLMIMLTLVGVFMAFSGIILHSMSRLIRENRSLQNSPQ